jgi:hypothetical protein
MYCPMVDILASDVSCQQLFVCIGPIKSDEFSMPMKAIGLSSSKQTGQFSCFRPTLCVLLHATTSRRNNLSVKLKINSSAN